MLSELRAAILSELGAAILAGLFFKLIESIRKQRELIAILIALKNECDYNSRHRGDETSPFQNYWLKRALSILEFHEQCPEIAKKTLEISELINDANAGQLNRRKMFPSNIQERLIIVEDEIDTILPSLKKRTDFFRYILWRWRR